ncbi:MAG: mechanosensitive ion channel family protein [Dehalococcoidales bacterium]|nr:mechanosensitive ion channel family protein [Dehalococcoidales bacterium]
MIALFVSVDSPMVLKILIPIAIAVGVSVICLLVWKLLYMGLTRWTKRARVKFLDSALQMINRTLFFWCFIAGVYVGIKTSLLPENWTDTADNVMAGLLIVSVALLIASFAGAVIAFYTSKAKLAASRADLLQNFVRGTILLLGVFVLLGTFDVDITSLIAALGIGSLAVALALQETLSNFFSGIYILLGKNIRNGDYVKVNSDVEGYVVNIGWRATTIRPFQNTLVIVPNSKLSQSIVTNFSLPEPWIQIIMPINVSYDTDVDKLERILLEEGKRAIKEVDGILPEFEPVVRFLPGFGDFSLNFVFVVRVKQFVDQYIVQHELRKRILKRFRAEGIEIPFPIRTIQMSNPKKVTKGEDSGAKGYTGESGRAVS